MKKIKLIFAAPLLSLAVVPTVTSCSKAKIFWKGSDPIKLEKVTKELYKLADSEKFKFEFDKSIWFDESEKDQYECDCTMTWKSDGVNCHVSRYFDPNFIIKDQKVIGWKSCFEVKLGSDLAPGDIYYPIFSCEIKIKHNKETIWIQRIDGIKLEIDNQNIPN